MFLFYDTRLPSKGAAVFTVAARPGEREGQGERDGFRLLLEKREKKRHQEEEK